MSRWPSSSGQLRLALAVLNQPRQPNTLYCDVTLMQSLLDCSQVAAGQPRFLQDTMKCDTDLYNLQYIQYVSNLYKYCDKYISLLNC